MINMYNWLSLLMDNFTLYGGGKGGGEPESPDYAELAKQQANSQIAINRQTTQANRPNQITPYGSIEWTQGGGTPVNTFDQSGYDAALKAYQNQLQQQSSRSGMNGALNNAWGIGGSANSASNLKAPDYNSFMRTSPNADQWTSTTKLTPELQAILDQNISAKGQSYDQLQQALGRINSNSLPQGPINPGQTAQDAIYARLNPELDRQQEALRTQLANQGLNIGSEAYQREMDRFGRQSNDAYSQAALQGIGLDFQNRNQALGEQAIPLNLINAYQSGSQAQMPTFQNFSQQSTAQAPDLLGAAQASYNNDLSAYNASQANQGNFMSGLFGLGGSIAGGMFGGPAGASAGGALGSAIAGGGQYSDIRLKSNIVKVGDHPKGFGIYEYDIFDRRERGVMAQEIEKIMPEAVTHDENGYKMVNYGALNG